VDVMLGLHPRLNLAHLIDGQCSLEETLLLGPAGVQVVPAASGIRRMADLSTAQYAGLIHAFSELSDQIDVLVVDTAAGISDAVVRFTLAAQEIVVVVCDEPASITDAYALVKVLSRDFGQQRYRILANMAPGVAEGRTLYRKLVKVTERFLDVSLDLMGVVPFDEQLRRAVQRQGAVVDLYPRSKAAMAFKKMADSTDTWPVPDGARGHLEFFMERLIQASHRGAEVHP
jgi:flagellar biosynthesis protein FlhG